MGLLDKLLGREKKDEMAGSASPPDEGMQQGDEGMADAAPSTDEQPPHAHEHGAEHEN